MTIQINVEAEKIRRRQELRGVLAMSIPMVVTTCTRMVMDLTDYVMISWIPGSDAQAAILPAQLVLWSFIVIGMGLVSIVSTFASQALGRGEHAECSIYAWQGVYISLVFGLLGFAMAPMLSWVIVAVGHEQAVQVLELEYCRVAIWSIGPTVAATALSAFFNGVHHPKVTMWTAIEGIAVNVAVSYALIFGLWGLPEMGIAGAAFGTVVATCYRCLRLGATMCRQKFDDEFQARSHWRINWSKLANLLRLGWPQGCQWLSDVVVWMLFVNVLVGRMFGTEHLIATGIAWQYLRVSFMPVMGIGMAVTSLVGKSIGQGDPQRAIRQVRLAVLLGGAYMVVLSLIYFVFRRELIGWFNDSPEIVAIGASLMICAAVFQVFDAMGIVYVSALRGAGDTFWSSALNVVCHWLILIGGGLVMARFFPQFGSIGPWSAATSLLVVLGILLWRRWHQRGWMDIDIFKSKKAKLEHSSRLPEHDLIASEV